MSTLDETDGTFSSQLTIGGDFNAHLHEELDNYGGRVEKKDSLIFGELGTLTKESLRGDKRNLLFSDA